MTDSLYTTAPVCKDDDPPEGSLTWVPSDGRKPDIARLPVPDGFRKWARGKSGSIKGVFEALIRLSRGCSWFVADMRRIASESGYSVRQARRCITILERAKWLQVKRYRPAGSAVNNSNEYRRLLFISG